MDNVVVSPHISWYSEEANIELRMRMAENMILTFKAGQPRSFVNKAVLEK
jgi:D-3-phosphoglycerate dehydrogenase